MTVPDERWEPPGLTGRHAFKRRHESVLTACKRQSKSQRGGAQVAGHCADAVANSAQRLPTRCRQISSSPEGQ